MFITRTFMSYLSSIASLLAGLSHYRLPKFLATALVGRLVWTAGYFGLGYGIGGDWEAATSFLTNLSVLRAAVGAAHRLRGYCIGAISPPVGVTGQTGSGLRCNLPILQYSQKIAGSFRV